MFREPRSSIRLLATLVLSCGCEALDPSDESSAKTVDAPPLFATAPDVASCSPGSLSDAYQERIIERVNQIRLLHELPPVSIADAELGPTQEAALVIVANATLSHGIGSDSFCYTSEAARSSSESLLFMSAGNEVGNVADPDRFLVDWLRDIDIPSLGHRRWLLDPFVSEVAFGFVQGDPTVSFPYSPVAGAALDIQDLNDVDLSWWANDFVAYPFGVYPASFFEKDWALSFSLIADKTQRLASVDRVSLDAVAVTVTDPSGNALVVTDVQSHYDLIGVPNALTWRVAGLEDGARYVVRISGVTIDGVAKDYEYEFVLVP
jgi:hypothetical protein